MDNDKIRTKVLERIQNLENSYKRIREDKPLKKGLKKLKGKKYHAPKLL